MQLYTISRFRLSKKRILMFYFFSLSNYKKNLKTMLNMMRAMQTLSNLAWILLFVHFLFPSLFAFILTIFFSKIWKYARNTATRFGNIQSPSIQRFETFLILLLRFTLRFSVFKNFIFERFYNKKIPAECNVATYKEPVLCIYYRCLLFRIRS